MFLSPRGRRVGRELVSRFPHVRVCDSNQDVLDKATSIVLAVRPQIVRTVVAELSFRPHHVVLSAVAGVRLDRLSAWTAPAGQVVRVIPLPQADRGQSLTAMYPDNSAARALFGRVGGVFVPGSEESLEAVSAATATFAAHLDHVTTIAGWLAEHGVDRGSATGYLAHIFGQLGESLLHHTDALTPLTEKHTTRAGSTSSS